MQLSEEDRFVIKTKAHDELLNEIEAIDAALSQPAEPPIEEVEAILACLGDDAALLREKNPECEIAANMDQAVALIRLLLAIPAADFGLSQPASEDARPAPEGFVLVPVEPTDAMVQATHNLDLSYMPTQWGADRAAVYKAMIAAAGKE